MRLLGNVLWFLLGGFLLGLVYLVVGILFCITIIGAPFGYQLMKIGVFAMLPFGQEPVLKNGEMGILNLVFNVLWIILGGLEVALLHLILGAFFCITIIGIPFGMQHFKLAKMAFIPFGHTIG